MIVKVTISTVNEAEVLDSFFVQSGDAMAVHTALKVRLDLQNVHDLVVSDDINDLTG